MEDCIFCKIIAGELPCHKIWEDENFLAFLDINPLDSGHTLVIPRKHLRWVWEVENFGEYFEKVKEVAKLLENKLKPEWIEIKVMGNLIPHAHVHLVPHYREGGKKLDILVG